MLSRAGGGRRSDVGKYKLRAPGPTLPRGFFRTLLSSFGPSILMGCLGAQHRYTPSEGLVSRNSSCFQASSVCASLHILSCFLRQLFKVGRRLRLGGTFSGEQWSSCHDLRGQAIFARIELCNAFKEACCKLATRLTHGCSVETHSANEAGLQCRLNRLFCGQNDLPGRWSIVGTTGQYWLAISRISHANAVAHLECNGRL